MKFKLLLLFAGYLLMVNQSDLLAQQDYRNNNQISTALRALVTNNASNAALESLTKTPDNNDIWALTLSNGNPDSNPALAIVAGVDGSHLLGVELAVRLADDILKNHKALLDHTTIYIFPNMSPDASAQYFSALKYERKANGSNTDDDRDGEKGEDAFEDLNGDNQITLMRVEDPTGSYKMLEADNRIMVKADINKGETGNYKIFSEGIDNDKDGHFNEDGAGGVIFNKNLSYNFPYFQPGAGEHPVSQQETRALLDYLYTKWNIHSILTFGPANNLSSPLKYNASKANKRVVTSILKKDADLNGTVSKAYNKIVPAKNAPKSITEGGGFFEWSYFHFGRMAMSTPAWWSPMPEKDTLKKESKNAEVNFLRWAEQNNIADAFTEWTTIKHPDFPNQKVEVGGIAPYKMANPPYKMLDDIVTNHAEFLADYLKMQASINITNLKQEDIGDGLTRITIDIHNPGLLPTHTEMGTRSRWLRKINVRVKLATGQTILSGKKHQQVNVIGADDAVQLSWLVKGKGKLELEAGAPHVGSASVSINL